jgi:hypothetical protein
VDALAAEVLAMEAGANPDADIPVEARFHRATASMKAAYRVTASLPKAVAAVTAASTTVTSTAPAVLRERRRRDRDADEARKAERERERSRSIHGRLLRGKVTTALASAFPGRLGRSRKAQQFRGLRESSL